MLKHVFIKSNILHRKLKLYIIERNVYNENIKDKQKENKIYIVICKHEASIRIKKDIASPGK